MGSHTNADPGFGRVFTDHMITARYEAGRGWSTAEVVPFADLAISPAAMVLHYGQAIFEGLKAFRQPDGSVALFRPDENAARFDRSAARLAMPPVPPGMFVEACLALVRRDEAWVPSEPGHSLYLRPLMVATEAALGVRPAHEYLFAVIASPVSSYFQSRVRPLTVWAADGYVRAAPGGTGSAKCAGNYAASLAAKAESRARGADETLFLDARHGRFVEELSGMNVVFVEAAKRRTTLVTPPVRDTVLDGVVRKSLLELGRSLGHEVVERPVTIQEVCDGRTFAEAFACGTAAVVAPIGAVASASGPVLVGDGTPGPVTLALREALVAVQEGRADDPFGWRWPVTAGAPAPA